MGPQESRVLPILPLPYGSVLLPGTSIVIPVSGRSDIPSILAAISSSRGRSASISTEFNLGCVPLNSPLLGSDGLPLPVRQQHHFFANEHTNPSLVDHRQLFLYGVTARVTGVHSRHTNDFSLTLQGQHRFRLDRFTQVRPHFAAEVRILTSPALAPSPVSIGPEPLSEAFKENFESFKNMSIEMLELVRPVSYQPQSVSLLSPFIAQRLKAYVSERDVTDASLLTDFMGSLVASAHVDKLRLLAQAELQDRLDLVKDLIAEQIEALKKQQKVTIIHPGVSIIRDLASNSDRRAKEALMRKALKHLSGQAAPGSRSQGDSDDTSQNEIEDLHRKVEEARMTPEALKVAEKEIQRLRKISPAQAEYTICRTYVETLTEIPWSRNTEDELDSETLQKARAQLDDDHYGLEKVKKRLLEYLAVLKLKQIANKEIDTRLEQIRSDKAQLDLPGRSEISPDRMEAERSDDTQILLGRRRVDKGPILLLVGPPGTGKTSLARSIATALGRKFHRLSLGGVRDEAEIRGHRRTYVAAMPGLIINGLRKVGVNNPVFLLDEIDKVGGSSIHGDPSAAMLEVLDPEQNYTFNDHYVNVPFDLSKVLFIATANTLDTISAPLLDRMETISLSGYTSVEKRYIARRHLLPKQITSNALTAQYVDIPDDTLDTIVTAYTRESGVRNLERELGSVCRFKAVQYAEAKDSDCMSDYHGRVTVEDLDEILGSERFEDEIASKESTPGVVTGLVAFGSSGQGSILFIEVVDMPGSGKVQLTGKLGDVLKESVEVALTWVKAHAFDLGLAHNTNEDIMKQRSIHVHCPSGAVPKDGPSAGLAHAMALISLFSGKSIPPELAMTGEISLRGRVLPVGGIKEKLIGAHRAGVKTVLLPNINRKDIRDVPQEVREAVNIIHVGHVWEAVGHVWPEWAMKVAVPVQSRL